MCVVTSCSGVAPAAAIPSFALSAAGAKNQKGRRDDDDQQHER